MQLRCSRRNCSLRDWATINGRVGHGIGESGRRWADAVADTFSTASLCLSLFRSSWSASTLAEDHKVQATELLKSLIPSRFRGRVLWVQGYQLALVKIDDAALPAVFDVLARYASSQRGCLNTFMRIRSASRSGLAPRFTVKALAPG